MSCIHAVEGVYQGRKVPLSAGRIDIGRDRSNGICVDADVTLSRRHATIFFKDGDWFCQDHGSTNGTFLDGRRVGIEPWVVPSGSIVSCGQQAFRLEYESQQESRVVPAISKANAIVEKERHQVGSIKPPADQRDQSVPSLSSGWRKMAWYGPGTLLELNGLRLESPLVYVGVNSDEPSMINPKLKVTDFHASIDLHVWASAYRDFEPQIRKAYLLWLACRGQGDAPEEFLLVYFFGIERRLSEIEGQLEHTSEYQAILSELEALANRYSHHGRFNHYARRVLANATLIGGAEVRFDIPCLEPWAPDDPDFLWSAARLARSGGSFDMTHVRQWERAYDGLFQSRVAGQRLLSEVLRRFEDLASEYVGTGIRLTLGGQRVHATAWYVNPSLKAKPASALAEAKEAREILKRLRDLAHTALEDLSPAAKRIGPDPSSSSKSRAVMYLPKHLFLVSETAVRLKSSLERYNGAVVELDAISEELKLGDEAFDKDLGAFVRCSSWLGFAAEPDPNIGVLPKRRIESVAIRNAGWEVPMASDALITAMQLVVIARSLDANSGSLADLISNRFNLLAIERVRIEAFIAYLGESTIAITKTLLVGVSEDDRELATDFLVGLVSVLPTSDRLNKLLKALSYWGCTKSDVLGMVHEATCATIVQHASRGPEFSIPPISHGTDESKVEDQGSLADTELKISFRPLSKPGVELSSTEDAEPLVRFRQVAEPSSKQNAPARGSRTKIDMAKLKTKLAETEQAAQILGSVFVEENADAAIVGSVSTDKIRTLISSLKHGPMPRIEFARLVDAIGYPTVAVAIDLLNELALDDCDELLLEGEDPVFIDDTVLERLKNA